MSDLNYLSDKEIELTPEADLLGSLVYVDQLIEMIKYTMKTKQVESIALFGDWGSGKSSVVKSLEQKLENNTEGVDVKFFTYNAWLYNNDSFRKNFIASIIDDKKEKQEYLKRVYTSETETNIKINDKLKKYWWFFLVIIVGIPFIFWIFELSIAGFSTKEVIDAMLKMFTLGIFAYFADFIFKKIAVETQITTHKEYSPYDFVNDFKCEQKKKQYYSVYLIDDIDRCSPIQVLEILETIKGLLKTIEENNYLFLIPLDKEKIISILQTERNYSYADSLDYFSKIFDLSLNMKKSGNINLFEMAKKNSNEIGLSISDRSLSILTDFIFTTPRNVKNTLNSLMVMFQLIRRQVSKGLLLDDINESFFDELIVIYILETKWKDFYDYLVINRNSLKQNLNKQLESFKDDRNQDAELKKFIGRLSIDRLEYLESYISLKNDNIAIDRDLLDRMIDRTLFKELEYEDYDNEKFISTLEYFYKIYFVERSLYHDYIINFVYIYFEYLENDDKERLDKISASKIDFNTIIRYISSQKNSKEFADRFVGQISEKLEMVKFSCLSNEINSFYLIYLVLLLNSKYTNKMISFAKSEMFDIINCKDDSKEEYVLDIIVKDTDNSDFEEIIDKFKYNNESLEKIIKVAIGEKRTDIISFIILINNELLIDNEEDVLEILSFKEQLTDLTNLDTTIKQKSFKCEMDILYLGLSKNLKNVISYVDSTRITTSCDSYLTQLLNLGENIPEKIIEKYVELIDKYDEKKYGDLQLTSKVIMALSKAKKNKFILELIELYNVEFANELFILAISVGNETIVENYINFIKDHPNANLDLWQQLTKNKTNISYNYQDINHQYSTIDYSFFTQYILLKLCRLNKEIAIRLMKNYTFKEIFQISNFGDFILKLKKNDERRVLLVDMIEDMDDYVECLKIVNKNSNKTKYHNAFRKVIANVSSIDKLKDIHNSYASMNTILDKTELNIIKDKVQKDFPQYQDDFNHISFKP